MPEVSVVSCSVADPSRWGIFRGSFRRLLGTWLMFSVVLEASLFGSGQMLHFGSVTLKMILLGVCILYTLLSLFCGDTISMGSTLLLSYFLAAIASAAAIGLVQEAQPRLIGEDISSQLYLLILPFFELTMRTKRELAVALRIIMFSSMLIAFAYVVVMTGLWTGSISMGDHYRLLVDNGDVIYDELAGRIFYKGSLYLGVAVIVFAFWKGRWAKVGLCISFIAVLLTVTRGFVLALFSVFLLYTLGKPGRLGAKVITICILFIVGGMFIPEFFSLAGDKAETDRIRLNTVSQVAERMNPLSAMVGHGFGVGVPERPEHMEIAYLEIFHKQGALGLAWFASLGMLLVLRFRRAIKSGNKHLAYALFLSAVFVFLESLTNPFIDNPIGLSVVIISLVGLKAIANPIDYGVSLHDRKEGAFGYLN